MTNTSNNSTEAEPDIVAIDAKIKKKFEDEYSKLPDYMSRLDEYNRTLSLSSLSKKTRDMLNTATSELSDYINQLESNTQLNFYIIESLSLLEEYRSILKVPEKLSFMGKTVKNNKKKQEIIRKYIEVASKYVDIDLSSKAIANDVVCNNCSNKKDFDVIEGNVYVCTKCCAQQTIYKHRLSYNDIDRVNISSKYMYDRKIHFRDCIYQYQGKQNSTIQPQVYKELEKEFEMHHLLFGDNQTPRAERFKNITKNHILMFLKELGYSNHYENVHLIHYNITGVKPNDISHLEDKLLDDFDVLTDLYDKTFKNINRKNFINTQYVLYQLLTRHKYPCNKEEFVILKTNDRKFFHDEVCRVLFNILGWNLNPFY
jgi:hypothetical protein